MTITIANGDRRMPHPDLAVVTGAFSYTGRYVTRRLLDQGVRVRTLTRSPAAEDPFGGRVEVAPLDFSDPDGLRLSMQGAAVFYNTYWVRYAHGRITFHLAVENTRMLFKAAQRAGVDRVIHFSVTNVILRVRATLLQRKSPGGGHAEGPRKSPTPSLGRPWYSAKATCCSTTWPGRYGAFPSSPSTGTATIPSNPSTSKT